MTKTTLLSRACRRSTSLAAAGVLTFGGIGATVLLTAGTASAAGCGSAVAAGSSCSLDGTATLSPGSLSLTSPSALAWTGTLNGANLHLVDPSDTSYTVNDATGSGDGWHITVSATTFTGTSSDSLADSGALLSTNGSTSSMSSGTLPGTACTSGTCSLPTNTSSYPVGIQTAASSPTPSTIYDASSSSGQGSINVSNVGWWLNVPAASLADTYTSTFTLQVISAP